MHCILKKKYINWYTTKINNFLVFFSCFYVSFYFSNAWGRNFAIYLRRKTPIKHMNLRHVNIVSQSYIGNTALRYTSKQIWAAQGQDARPVPPPPPGHGAPGSNLAASHHDGFGNGAEGSEKSCAQQKLLGENKGCFSFTTFCSWRRERWNTAGERAWLAVPRSQRNPTLQWFCQKPAIKKQRQKWPPPQPPKKNPQTWH